MLRLFIDNREVYLDAEINFQYFRENPLFNKTGDYTFNIDINTRNKNNSAIYSNIRKIGNHFNVKNRRAILLDGEEEILNGTEVILAANERIVSIQIVNGTSELNYLANSDNRRVRELNLGSASMDVGKGPKDVSKKLYPETNFVFPPIRISNELYNQVDIRYDDYVYGSKVKPMPYLLFYTKAVIEAMGYTMTLNQLASVNKWRRLVMCHGYNTSEFAKMLPDWSVSEFIDEIEKFFNAIYVVDSKKKEVQLLTIKDFYENKPAVTIPRNRIIDAFERTYKDEKEDLYITYQNVQYSFPKDKGFELCDLPDEINNRVAIVEKDYDTASGVDENWDDWTVYKDTQKTNFFFKPYMKYTTSADSSSRAYYKRRVNDFAKYVKDKEGNTVSLKIIPTHIIQNMTTATNEGGMLITAGTYQIPSVDYHEFAEDNLGFYESVDGETVSQDVESCINVAFYEGNAHIRSTGNNYVYHYAMPMCWCSEWTAGFITANTFREEEIPGYIGMTLELNGPNGRGLNDFDSDFNIDHDQAYTIRFLSKDILDPMDIFEFDGTPFACKKLTYEWKNGKRTGIVEGEFYHIKN